MKYTVLLLRPDYVASDYGQDTYLAHVEAANVGDAERQARSEAYAADRAPDDRTFEDPEKLSDYYVLFVATGWLDDLRSGE